ncbi:DNA methylase N-4/N-6 domain-containing protein [Burkholderia pseudomallei]|uniref:site-specific DNA-methyltransferase n=1 Tax=Burkholderia pseudomallei TaxID=28450 RepID=UPI00097819BB|nr:site-specific DNA-methyltransferase [Burkholderia pseudomallei]OMS46606.1 DNA methylase N-4 [Burkholderia pseudomallei]CAJ3063209.1 DNA methylase N-4/N-6 domain-containing protein [Burkholderia pseudomallei]CAJ3071462.1 DNA methylase N-4/N-6 domain-containing protein [Burkholderia pseudomallei]CAJ3706399.1 DNA methylase N-4/N-6 domain-containing protein [Burkholderia pseudomallei]CAJ3726558.1 DNA methylase N-4/N-6 domain-containing protein [Burkholderia pseudomallei]
MNLHIDYRPIESLIPYARNARTHSDEQIAQIAASIREFGFNNPVLVDGHHGVIAGHGRILAARQLGMTELPVIELVHLTETQKRAFILAENRLTERAGWDDELLSLELADLQAVGFDLELTGFDDEAIAKLLDEDADHEGKQDDDALDDAPEPPLAPVTRTGDIWLIGKHRLICGDASDASAVAAVMDGRQASLCFTSPPYGNQRDYTGAIGDWDELMRGVFATLPMAPEGQVLVNLGLIHRENEVIPYWDGWLHWMQSTGWRRFAWYVWDQGPGMPGDWNGRLAPSFEFVFHFNRVARRPNKIVPCRHAGEDSHLRADGTSTAMRRKDGEVGGWSHAGKPTQDMRIPDSVIRIMRHKGPIGDGIDHPAVFPVALPEHIMLAYANAGDVVFEPFNGSGTSLLAAERTGRHCRSVEIAPEYADVAIRRFLQHYPDASVTLAESGRTFEEVEAERVTLPEANHA